MRIHIVGAPGSGKTTLGARAADRLGVAHLELDAVFWDAGWEFRDLDEARAAVRAFVAEHPDGWVMDGNWTTRLGGTLAEVGGVDQLVWLDHARWLVMSRVVSRTLVRGATGRELWHGNRERVQTWFSRERKENIVLLAWWQVGDMRERLGTRVGEPGFVRQRGRRAVRAWLAALPAALPAPDR